MGRFFSLSHSGPWKFVPGTRRGQFIFPGSRLRVGKGELGFGAHPLTIVFLCSCGSLQFCLLPSTSAPPAIAGVASDPPPLGLLCAFGRPPVRLLLCCASVAPVAHPLRLLPLLRLLRLRCACCSSAPPPLCPCFASNSCVAAGAASAQNSFSLLCFY